MTRTPIDPEIRAAAADHLVKAVLATLAVKDPDFIDQVRDIFLIATAYDSRIAPEREAVWAEVQSELQAVEALVKGPLDDDEGEGAPNGLLMDGAADGFLNTGT
jgi:hypothetical protein